MGEYYGVWGFAAEREYFPLNTGEKQHSLPCFYSLHKPSTLPVSSSNISYLLSIATHSRTIHTQHYEGADTHLAHNTHAHKANKQQFLSATYAWGAETITHSSYKLGKTREMLTTVPIVAQEAHTGDFVCE